MTVQRTYWNFDVAACNDASLALAPAPTKDLPAYEVILGASGNTRISISRDVNGTLQKNVYKNQLLKCNETQSFWISWFNGQIKVIKLSWRWKCYSIKFRHSLRSTLDKKLAGNKGVDPVLIQHNYCFRYITL